MDEHDSTRGNAPRSRAAPVSSAAEAVAAFTAFWRTNRPSSGILADTSRLGSLVDGTTPTAQRVTYASYRALVTDRLGVPTPGKAILFGSERALARAGDCWEINYDGRVAGGLDACVDAATGEVVFIWETPGG